MCGERGCWHESPHLVPGRGVSLVRDLESVSRWWSERPYAVAVVTGAGVHVAEVRGGLGVRAFARLGSRRSVWGSRRGGGPVWRGPRGEWYFPMQPGALVWPWPTSEVVIHGQGSWVLLPPSRTVQGALWWQRRPCGPLPGCLPEAGVVLGALELAAVRQVGGQP